MSATPFLQMEFFHVLHDDLCVPATQGPAAHGVGAGCPQLSFLSPTSSRVSIKLSTQFGQERWLTESLARKAGVDKFGDARDPPPVGTSRFAYKVKRFLTRADGLPIAASPNLPNARNAIKYAWGFGDACGNFVWSFSPYPILREHCASHLHKRPPRFTRRGGAVHPSPFLPSYLMPQVSPKLRAQSNDE